MSVVDDAVLNYSEITSIRYCSSTRIRIVNRPDRIVYSQTIPVEARDFLSAFVRFRVCTIGVRVRRGRPGLCLHALV